MAISEEAWLANRAPLAPTRSICARSLSLPSRWPPTFANAAERLAVFTKNATNPNYTAFRLGADRAAAKFGASTYHRVPAKPDDAEQQIEMLESAIKDRPDAILLAVADDRMLGPTVQKINSAGIPYIAFVDRSPTGHAVTFVGSDDFAMGQATARYLAEKMGGKGNSSSLKGLRARRPVASASRDFVALSRAIQTSLCWPQCPDGTRSRMPSRRWRSSSANIQRSTRSSRPTTAWRSAFSTRSTPAGRKALVTGINGTIEAAQAIATGRLLASEDYSGFDMGCIASEAAIRILRGQKVPEEILLPVKMIDLANVDRWLVPVSSGPVPTGSRSWLPDHRNEACRR